MVCCGTRFGPSKEIRTMRTYWRQRNDLVRTAGRHIQRMQKAQMNIQLANVLRDVSGMTGQAIVKAILAGERDPYELAALRNWRVKASAEESARISKATGRKNICLSCSRSRMGTSFACSRWPNAISGCSNIFSSNRPEAKEPVCRKKSGRNG